MVASAIKRERPADVAWSEDFDAPRCPGTWPVRTEVLAYSVALVGSIKSLHEIGVRVRARVQCKARPKTQQMLWTCPTAHTDMVLSWLRVCESDPSKHHIWIICIWSVAQEKRETVRYYPILVWFISYQSYVLAYNRATHSWCLVAGHK